MTTTNLQLTDANYTLVSTGPCLVTPAILNIGNLGTANDSDLYQNTFLVHVGSSLPSVSTFNYHEFDGVFQYMGSEKVYMRTDSGTAYIKITPLA